MTHFGDSEWDRLTAENEMRAADYLKLCKEFDVVTAEREANKAAFDEYQRKAIAERDALKAELERMASAVETWTQHAYESDLMLRELREAAEVFKTVAGRYTPSIKGTTGYKALAAVLAKLQPTAAPANDGTTYREVPLERDTDPTPPNTERKDT